MKISKYQSVVVIGLVVFIVLGFLMQIVAGWLLPMLQAQSNANILLLSVMKTLEHSAISTFTCVGSGVVLLLLTRDKKLYCILWALLGLSLGVLGVVLFFATEVYERNISKSN
jgi:hypothetical protein